MSSGLNMNSEEMSIKDFLLQVIKEASDLEYQKRIWVRGEGPEIGSVEEFYCKFFDDLNIEEIFQNYKKYDLTKKQVDLVKKLYKLLDEYSDQIPITPIDREVVGDPRWVRIQDFAKKVYDQIVV